MNKVDLKTILKEADVADELYNLSGEGRDDERFFVVKNDMGWNVYFMERGIKTIDKSFNTESDACQYIYEQLIE